MASISRQRVNRSEYIPRLATNLSNTVAFRTVFSIFTLYYFFTSKTVAKLSQDPFYIAYISGKLSDIGYQRYVVISDFFIIILTIYSPVIEIIEPLGKATDETLTKDRFGGLSNLSTA